MMRPVASLHRHEHEHPHVLRPAAALRQRGRRLTRQRAAIRDVLAVEPGAHLSADGVAGRVRSSLPGVHALAALGRRVAAATGFARLDREITLFGLCRGRTGPGT